MKKLFLALLFFATLSCFGQQERLIVFGGSPWFSFDPISGSYRSGSLAQLASYVEAWKLELDDENVHVTNSKNFLQTMPNGYQAYNYAKDSTLLKDIFSYLNVTPVDEAKFQLSKYNTDTLKDKHILVIDRWDFLGEISFAHKVVDIGDFPLSKDFNATFDRQQQQVKHFFSTPIANLPTDYSTRNMFFGPSVLGNLLHNFQLTFGDVSIIAPGKRDLTWKAGELYIKDIYDMFSYDNDLSIVSATGKQLKEFMEEIYGDRYYTYKRASDDLVKMKTPYFFHDGVAGVDFEVNVSNNKGKRIQNHNIDPNKLYKIAISSFRAKWFEEQKCNVQNIGQFRLLLLKWFSKNDIKTLPNVEKWSIVPNIDINQTIERELKSAFE